MTRKEIEEAILRGLAAHGHAHISAFEWGTVGESLVRLGYVEIWPTMGGFDAWRITEEGLRYVGYKK